MIVYVCAEGMYADQRKKEIVKIIVDDKFDNTGWLGMLAAGTLYVEFHDPRKFDDKMLELVNELRRLLQLQQEG